MVKVHIDGLTQPVLRGLVDKIRKFGFFILEDDLGGRGMVSAHPGFCAGFIGRGDTQDFRDEGEASPVVMLYGGNEFY